MSAPTLELGVQTVALDEPSSRTRRGGRVDDSPWRDLDRVFLENHPLRDTLSVPMLARTTTIGLLSLGRFGSDASPFTDHDREFTDDLATRVGLAVENARLYEHARSAIEHARSAIELRDTFLTVAAHELKTLTGAGWVLDYISAERSWRYMVGTSRPRSPSTAGRCSGFG